MYSETTKDVHGIRFNAYHINEVVVFPIPAFPHSFKDSPKFEPLLAPKWLKATAPEMFRWFSRLFPTVPDCSVLFRWCSGLFPRRSVLFRRCSGLFHAVPCCSVGVPGCSVLFRRCSGLFRRCSVLFRCSGLVFSVLVHAL